MVGARSEHRHATALRSRTVGCCSVTVVTATLGAVAVPASVTATDAPTGPWITTVRYPILPGSSETVRLGVCEATATAGNRGVEIALEAGLGAPDATLLSTRSAPVACRTSPRRRDRRVRRSRAGTALSPRSRVHAAGRPAEFSAYRGRDQLGSGESRVVGPEAGRRPRASTHPTVHLDYCRDCQEREMTLPDRCDARQAVVFDDHDGPGAFSVVAHVDVRFAGTL
ncbi:MAG: hypothetical protein QOE27_2554 [Solirubrobacteraceae bacterium]|nr:hypothetical protein [Solirubrobacteraceae bacterium]